MKRKDKGRIILRNVWWTQLTSSLFSYSCLVIVEVFVLWKPKYTCLRLLCTKVSAANVMTEGFQQSSVHKVYYRACWKESPNYDRYSSRAGENKSLFSTKAWFRSEVCTYFARWSHESNVDALLLRPNFSVWNLYQFYVSSNAWVSGAFIAERKYFVECFYPFFSFCFQKIKSKNSLHIFKAQFYTLWKHNV